MKERFYIDEDELELTVICDRHDGSTIFTFGNDNASDLCDVLNRIFKQEL